MKWKFKKFEYLICSDDPLYDMMYKEKLSPEVLLVEEKQILEINNAIEVLRSYLDNLESEEIIKFYE